MIKIRLIPGGGDYKIDTIEDYQSDHVPGVEDVILCEGSRGEANARYRVLKRTFRAIPTPTMDRESFDGVILEVEELSEADVGAMIG